MAPYKVKLPMDFGIRHLRKPAHGNLVFKLKDGVEVRVNSVILSLNSPVIARMTNEYDQKTVDVDDFTKEAVDVFVEAMYSGEVKNMDNSNFREINKMAHAFHVFWLKKHCWKYFKEEICSDLLFHKNNKCDYNVPLYCMDEAFYVLKTQKNSHFIDYVTDLLVDSTIKKIFLEKYMEDLKSMDHYQLDFIINVTGSNVEILIEALTIYLAQNGNSLDNNIRFILRSLAICHSSQADKLLEMLDQADNASTEDYRMAIGFYKNLASGQASYKTTSHRNKIIDFTDPADDNPVTSLSLEEFLEYLDVNKKIKSHYLTMEEILLWLSEQSEHENWDYFTNLSFIDKIAALGLRPVSVKFLKNCSLEISQELIDTIKMSQLVTKVSFRGEYVLESQEMITLSQLFCQENRIHFYFTHPKSNSCDKSGDCGFILRTIPASKDNSEQFDIILSVDKSDYSDDIHIHEEFVSVENMHLTLVHNLPSRTHEHPGVEEKQIYVSKTSRPVYKICETNKVQKSYYWKWGSYKFAIISPSMTSHKNLLDLSAGRISLRIFYSII